MHKATRAKVGGRRSKTFLYSMLSAVSILAAGLPQGAVHAQKATDQIRQIKVPSGPVGPILVVLAETYGINVVADNILVKGKVSTAVAGAYGPQDALAATLSGTGLVAKRDGDGAFIVTKKKVAARKSRKVSDRTGAKPEEIIVLGRKSIQSYFEVTESVSVVTGEEIEREPLADLYDIVTRIPNVNRQTQNGIGFAIRGIQDIGPARAGGGPLLVTYVDDAPLNGPGAGLGPTGAWDLEQVEVYRGPQSTNFGRNALAGAIYMRTKDPEYDWNLKARAEIGNAGQRWGALAFGGGIIEDRLAFRVAADYRETEGFIFNPFLNSFNDNTEVWNTRLKLRFDPFEDLSIITTTTYAENLGGAPNVNLGPQVNGELQDASDAVREAPTDVDSFFKSQNILQSVNLNWDISDSLFFQSITTYQVTDYSTVNDGDLGPEVVNLLRSSNENKTFTQEVRLSYRGDSLTLSLGGFYSDITSENFFTQGINASGFLPIPIPVFINRNSDGLTDRENFALFVDGEYDLTDSLSLIFGFRYDDESFVSTSFPSNSLDPFPLPPEVPAQFVPLLLGAAAGTDDPVNVNGSYNAALPKAGIRWQPSNDFNIAFVAQRAYRAGGSQTNPDNPAEQIPFEPEYLWNYELSSRASFLGGRLTWNNNIFYSRWTDMQVRLFSEGALGEAGFGFTGNAGEAELYGAETELNFKINSVFTAYFSAGYLQTEFLEFVNTQFDPDAPIDPVNSPNYNGNEFNAAPEFSFNGGLDYRGPEGLFGGVDFSYQANSFNSPFNVPENFAGERVLFNARVGYEINENFSLSAVGRNLFDQDYFIQAFRGPEEGRGQLGDPLTWAIRLDFNF